MRAGQESKRQEIRRQDFYFLCLAGLLLAFLPLIPAQAQTILIENDACAYAAQHTPDADVTYQPGTDADGKETAPADLPPAEGGAPPIKTPTVITIPLLYDLQTALHLPNTNYVSPNASVGTIKYDHGALTFNGQPMNDQSQAALIAACRQGKAQKTSPKHDLLRGE